MLINKWKICFLLIPLFLYLLFSLRYIELPGPTNEDSSICLDISPLFGREVSEVRSIKFLGITFPVKAHPYHVTGRHYFWAPFFLAGVNITNLRIGGVFWGGIILISFFFLTWYLFNDLFIAFFSTLLLGTHPTFIIGSRSGAVYNSLHMLMSTLSLIFFLKWKNNFKDFYLFLVGCFLGIGMTTHSSFIFFLVSMFFMVVFNIVKSKILKLKRISVFVFGILLGSILFLIVEISFDFETVKYFLSHFSNTGQEANNTEYFLNLKERITQLFQLLNGSALQLRECVQNIFSIKYYSILFIFGFFYCLLNKKRYFLKELSILLLIFLLLTPFSLSLIAMQHIHIIAIFPVAFLISVSNFLNLIKTKIVSILVVVFLFVMNIMSMANYYKFNLKTGGVNAYSDAIYRLADWIRKNDVKKIICMDHEIYESIYFFTNIKPVWQNCNGRKLSDKELDNIFKEFIMKNEVFCVAFHNSHNINNLKKFAKKFGKKIVLKETFYRRDGVPVYEVYGVLN